MGAHGCGNWNLKAFFYIAFGISTHLVLISQTKCVVALVLNPAGGYFSFLTWRWKIMDPPNLLPLTNMPLSLVNYNIMTGIIKNQLWKLEMFWLKMSVDACMHACIVEVSHAFPLKCYEDSNLILLICKSILFFIKLIDIMIINDSDISNNIQQSKFLDIMGKL